MIIPVILFVGPSRLVSMLDVGPHDYLDEIAQNAANQFPDINYFFADLVVESPQPEFWPELEIKWTNWYGKIVTENTYACFPVDTKVGHIVTKIPMTGAELANYAVTRSEVILFVHNGEEAP